ncbi:PASTA domain-containing protein [Aureibacter tunicatorum]|uniref:Beta-lactam-binding protein with PASTA domain n=1 Tax=Aureibacter tunicatorum TaxID=866807 RepID=A0AAE3XK96_9BACT|nr:PASTA domain-containing protein [Aureibacter tunicatorum]MDR6239346.1 beta-lactam-binding protein with PASTA domain [Aureibacter tunicatorum]BDD04731.1 hypothetical protein AUTU_22140 [Aureibacter tunicatorum]
MRDKLKNIGFSVANLAIMGVVTMMVLYGYFNVYLPYITKHDETITVPNLKGVREDQLEEFLTQRHLNYVIKSDSGYSAEFPVKSVLKQEPKAGSRVKENRKIYLTLNASTPPQIKMPNLIDGSLKNARIILESLGLKLGSIEYVPDLAINAVLKQKLDGEEIEPGQKIYKGSSIDLVIGDGLGKTAFEIGDYINMPLDEAEMAILGSNLKLGSIINVNVADSLMGKVIKQNPEFEEKVKVGQSVDLWVGNYNEYLLQDSLDIE